MKQIGSPQSEVDTSLSTYMYHYISIVKVGDSVFFKAAKKRSANVKGKKSTNVKCDSSNKKQQKTNVKQKKEVQM